MRSLFRICMHLLIMLGMCMCNQVVCPERALTQEEISDLDTNYGIDVQTPTTVFSDGQIETITKLLEKKGPISDLIPRIITSADDNHFAEIFNPVLQGNSLPTHSRPNTQTSSGQTAVPAPAPAPRPATPPAATPPDPAPAASPPASPRAASPRASRTPSPIQDTSDASDGTGQGRSSASSSVPSPRGASLSQQATLQAQSGPIRATPPPSPIATRAPNLAAGPAQRTPTPPSTPPPPRKRVAVPLQVSALGPVPQASSAPVSAPASPRAAFPPAPIFKTDKSQADAQFTPDELAALKRLNISFLDTGTFDYNELVLLKGLAHRSELQPSSTPIQIAPSLEKGEKLQGTVNGANGSLTPLWQANKGVQQPRSQAQEDGKKYVLNNEERTYLKSTHRLTVQAQNLSGEQIAKLRELTDVASGYTPLADETDPSALKRERVISSPDAGEFVRAINPLLHAYNKQTIPQPRTVAIPPPPAPPRKRTSPQGPPRTSPQIPEKRTTRFSFDSSSPLAREASPPATPPLKRTNPIASPPPSKGILRAPDSPQAPRSPVAKVLRFEDAVQAPEAQSSPSSAPATSTKYTVVTKIAKGYALPSPRAPRLTSPRGAEPATKRPLMSMRSPSPSQKTLRAIGSKRAKPVEISPEPVLAAPAPAPAQVSVAVSTPTLHTSPPPPPRKETGAVALPRKELTGLKDLWRATILKNQGRSRHA